ncbi:hypothetical protein V4W41_01775 [Pseudomonas aeruginosa]|uniref:hypothetical protein n=1 Tax=Pseudomonas aeruginosa TaxID=287 RepID=UPI0032E4FC91
MAPKKRLKSAAAVYVPQTREQVISDIKNIGDLQRELASVRAAVFATAEPHQVGQKVARRVPGVSPDATDRENLGSIARYIQTLGQQDRPGFRALGV